jgi:hypothetical protein
VGRECIVFISSVGSISIVSSELKKETFVFFSSNRRCQIKHRLVAVKEHVSFYHRIEQQFGTRFCAHFRFSEDDYIDCACRIVVVVVSFELFETTVSSVSIALLVLVYVKPGW